MRRGKTQVTYRYLPGMYIDFDDGNCIAYIDRWDSYEIKEGVNKMRIADQIKKSTARFGERRMFENKKTEDFVLLSPRYAMQVELSPLTFTCGSCGRAHSYSDLSHFERNTQKRYRCETCGGKLKQLDLIYRHACGYAGQVEVRHCSVHGNRNMRLVRGASIGEYRWVCETCGKEISLNTKCPSCSDPTHYIYPVPFRQGDVYMRKGFSIINLPFIDEPKLYADPQAAKLIIGEYLGLTAKHGSDAKDLMDTKADAEAAASAEKAQKDFEKWRQAGFTEEQIQMVLGSSIVSKTPFKKSEIRNGVCAEVDKLIPYPPEELRSTAISVFEYMETLKTQNKKTIPQVVTEAKEQNSPAYASVSYFPKLLAKIGVANACVLGDLSMVSVAYGFTREEDEGDGAFLNPFNFDKLDGKRVPIYINQTQTEAILLEFDRKKITSWLKENKKIPSLPHSDDEASLKIWFLSNINTDAIDSFSGIPETEPVTKSVYGLLHSITHSLLLRATSQCGLDKDSLGELIFPAIPAVLIYSNNSAEFQLGGLFTLFESRIRPWVDMAMEGAESCIYDPLCIDSIGACHSCLQTSEISCEHFNKDLNRQFLIGRSGETGFWEKKFQKRFEK